ncbi:1369_t:CDS:2 [Paraglomus occultum]|uniref:1369_t:CDS:1 n=1 Tax=Paraglomus occultum TaxID=144539 RepID=A0A9N9GBZ5_9GLOM|nr:1369_t:CDS:2 [Paraglomus occultum]
MLVSHTMRDSQILKNVSFRVQADIPLSIRRRQVNCLASTITLLQYHEGCDVRNVKQHDLRSKIGLVSQDKRIYEHLMGVDANFTMYTISFRGNVPRFTSKLTRGNEDKTMTQ